MQPASDIPPDTTDDAFLGGALSLLQPVDGYRAGLDAVLLAAVAPVSTTAPCTVLDAGSGVGTVGLSVAWRCPSARVTLVERELRLVDLALLNAARNGLSPRVTVVEADLTRGGAMAQGTSAADPLRPAAFDHLLANPPYRVAGTGTAPAGLRQTSNQLASGDLDRWLAALVTLARTGASLTMIHETAALPELLAALDGRFGAIRIWPVASRAGEPAQRILVDARKGSRAPLQLLAPLVVHGESQAFTPAIEAVVRRGAALAFGAPAA